MKSNKKITLADHARSWYALHGIAMPEQTNRDKFRAMYEDWAMLPMSGSQPDNDVAEKAVIAKWKK
jgi:hypothetical protein